jgi:hypothetical protein
MNICNQLNPQGLQECNFRYVRQGERGSVPCQLQLLSICAERVSLALRQLSASSGLEDYYLSSAFWSFDAPSPYTVSALFWQKLHS